MFNSSCTIALGPVLFGNEGTVWWAHSTSLDLNAVAKADKVCDMQLTLKGQHWSPFKT